jgi:hypothetical protein
MMVVVGWTASISEGGCGFVVMKWLLLILEGNGVGM